MNRLSSVGARRRDTLHSPDPGGEGAGEGRRPAGVASAIDRRGALTLFGGPLIALAAGGAARAAAGSLDLTRFAGKVVYLDFWASWCAPCRLSFPYMQQLAAEMAGQPFALVTVNVDHDRRRADAFLSQVGGGLPVVFDPKGAIASRFGVKAMPTSLLIGRDGRVRFTHQGFELGQTSLYEAQITELLHAR